MRRLADKVRVYHNISAKHQQPAHHHHKFFAKQNCHRRPWYHLGDGRVADCQIVGSSGWPVLDAVACQKIAARARFAPATDSGGEAVVGSFTSNIRWVIPE